MTKATTKKSTTKKVVKKPKITKTTAKKAVVKKEATPIEKTEVTDVVKKEVSPNEKTEATNVTKKEALLPKTTKKVVVKKEQPKEKIKKAVSKKVATKKTSKVVSKKVAKKPVVKNPTTKPTPKTATNTEITLPKFVDLNEMKMFCVTCGLNKIDGYIPASKQNKVNFLKWMEENKNKAVLPSTQGLTDNPHSPHSGIGDMESNIEKAKNAIGNIETSKQNPNNEKEAIYSEVKIDTPPLKTSDNTNEMPTALTGMNEAMNHGVNSQQNTSEPTNQEPEHGKGNAELNAYAESILMNIKESFSVKFHGAFDRQEYQRMINNADKRYTYETKQEGGGTFLIIKDGYSNEVRVPEKGFLPM